MAFFFRKLDKKRYFDKPLNGHFTKLGHDDIWADALRAFDKIEKNTLSFYKIDNDSDQLERTIAALTTSSGFVNQMDYGFFDTIKLDTNIVKIIQNNGETSDNVVNSWHYDFTNLSGKSLVHLCVELLNGKITRANPNKIRQYLNDSHSLGYIDWQISNLSIDKLK
jgi:hypothetical protein